MKKSKNLRETFFLQIMVAVLIAAAFAAVATQARAGYGITAEEITDKYGNIVVVKTNSTKVDLDRLTVKQTEVIGHHRRAQAKSSAKHSPKPKQSNFDDSIHTALSKMGLNADSVSKWTEQHPKSALKELEKMSPSMQTKVANIATFIRSVNSKIDKKTAWREAAAIVHYCAKYNISPELAAGVAKTESNFNPEVTSKAGARGVMQVMWKYHAGMLKAKGIASSQEQLFDPERSIESGILLLSRYAETYGSIQKALNRYYGKVSDSYAKKINRNVAMLQNHTEKIGF